MIRKDTADRLKDFSFMENTDAPVPAPAVRKLYRLAKEMSVDLDRMQILLNVCEATHEPIGYKPPPIDISVYTNQIREMADEIKGLNEKVVSLEKDLEITTKSRDSWQTDALRETQNNIDKIDKINELEAKLALLKEENKKLQPNHTPQRPSEKRPSKWK